MVHELPPRPIRIPSGEVKPNTSTSNDHFAEAILSQQDDLIKKLGETEKGKLLAQGAKYQDGLEELRELGRQLQSPDINDEARAGAMRYIEEKEQAVTEKGDLSEESDLHLWHNIRNEVLAGNYKPVSYQIHHDMRRYATQASESLAKAQVLDDGEHAAVEEKMKMNLIALSGLRSPSEDREVHAWFERQPKSLWLEDAFTHVPFTRNRALPDSVRSLELGSIGEEADELMVLTRDDEASNEWNRLYYVASNGELMSEEPFRGEANQSKIVKKNVRNLYMDQTTSRRFQADRFPVVPMHTHGLDITPPSPEDFASLVSTTNGALENSAVMVVTPVHPSKDSDANKTIVFRSSDTPFFSEQELGNLFSEWYREIDRRKLLNPIVLFGDTTIEEIEKIRKESESRVQWSVLREYAKKLHLRVFSTEHGENVAKLVNTE